MKPLLKEICKLEALVAPATETAFCRQLLKRLESGRRRDRGDARARRTAANRRLSPPISGQTANDRGNPASGAGSKCLGPSRNSRGSARRALLGTVRKAGKSAARRHSLHKRDRSLENPEPPTTAGRNRRPDFRAIPPKTKLGPFAGANAIQTMTSLPADVQLAYEVAKYYADPLGFVRMAFPWGKKGTPLEDQEGPDVNQTQFLMDVAAQVRAVRFNGRDPVMPILMCVSSGHGTGKSVMGAWLAIWILSTRPHSIRSEE